MAGGGTYDHGCGVLTHRHINVIGLERGLSEDGGCLARRVPRRHFLSHQIGVRNKLLSPRGILRELVRSEAALITGECAHGDASKTGQACGYTFDVQALAKPFGERDAKM